MEEVGGAPGIHSRWAMIALPDLASCLVFSTLALVAWALAFKPRPRQESSATTQKSFLVSLAAPRGHPWPSQL